MIINPAEFEKIYNSGVNYGPAAKILSNLAIYDPQTLAQNMASGWSGSASTYYLSENRIGAYAGYMFDTEYNIETADFYIGRYSGQNNTLFATVQVYINGAWTDVQDLEVTTTIPYPNNIFSVTINQRCAGIRWNHYKTPNKTSENNIIFFGIILYGNADPTFTVEFDANGGTGEMADQSIVIDTPTALTACTFTREDYMFSGWATEQGGPVVYADGEIVENLAESGETVTLYAVWTAAPLSIVLQYNSSDRDHLDKELEDVRTLYGVFREECEITDPVILLEGDPSMLQGVNYFTVKALGRSYYLTGCRVIRANLLEIAGHVDVLSSFKDAIREQVAIVRRAESDQAYNLYLNDGSLHVYADPYILTEPFPAGFTSPSFILAVAGSAGS